MKKNIPKKDLKSLFCEATLKSEFIRRQILRQILSGDYAPGDTLPSETVLCKQFGVSRNTVRQALEGLTNEGMVNRIRGKGTFVAQLTSTNKHAGKSNIFCLVMPYVNRDLHPALINGFSEGAAQIQRQVMLATTNNDLYRQGSTMLEILDANMGGVAVVPALGKITPPHHIEQVQKNNIPVVLCNRPIEGVSTPLVTWNWEEVGRITAKHFLSLGHRRIGYFSDVDHPSTHLHVSGMQEILIESGNQMKNNNIIFSSHEKNDEFKKGLIQNMLTRKDRPTAILCDDDTEAEVVFWSAVDMGFKIPDDLAIIGFGVSDRNAFQKRLTSVTIDGFELGRKVVTLLTEMQSGIRAITNNEVFHVDLGFSLGSTT